MCYVRENYISAISFVQEARYVVRAIPANSLDQIYYRRVWKTVINSVRLVIISQLIERSGQR
jgi:hypothetical protein